MKTKYEKDPSLLLPEQGYYTMTAVTAWEDKNFEILKLNSKAKSDFILDSQTWKPQYERLDTTFMLTNATVVLTNTIQWKTTYQHYFNWRFDDLPDPNAGYKPFPTLNWKVGSSLDVRYDYDASVLAVIDDRKGNIIDMALQTPYADFYPYNAGDYKAGYGFSGPGGSYPIDTDGRFVSAGRRQNVWSLVTISLNQTGDVLGGTLFDELNIPIPPPKPIIPEPNKDGTSPIINVVGYKQGKTVFDGLYCFYNKKTNYYYIYFNTSLVDGIEFDFLNLEDQKSLVESYSWDAAFIKSSTHYNLDVVYKDVDKVDIKENDYPGGDIKRIE